MALLSGGLRDEHDAAEAEAERLAAQLTTLLPSDQRHLVYELRRAEETAALLSFMDWQQRFLDAVVRHLPRMGLVLHAVAYHVTATNAQPDCCRHHRPG